MLVCHHISVFSCFPFFFFTSTYWIPQLSAHLHVDNPARVRVRLVWPISVEAGVSLYAGGIATGKHRRSSKSFRIWHYAAANGGPSTFTMGGVPSVLLCLWCRGGCSTATVAAALTFFPPSPPCYTVSAAWCLAALSVSTTPLLGELTASTCRLRGSFGKRTSSAAATDYCERQRRVAGDFVY